MNETLYIDLDGTLLDTVPLFQEAEQALFGRVMPEDDKTHWYYYRDFHGANYYAIFDYALSVDMIPKRRMYEGVVPALYFVHYSLGLNIHIISHNKDYERMYVPYKEWLDTVLADLPFEFTLFEASNCKIKTMQADESALGIVEDKPDTIRKAIKAGYPTYIKSQPWNHVEREELREKDNVYIFDDWVRMPELVGSTLNKLTVRV